MWNSSSESNNDHIKRLESQLSLARREINNLRQQLKSLNYSHRKECEEINNKLQNWRCLGCRNQVTDQNGAEAAAGPPLDLMMKQIGVISTNFPEKRGTPRQPGICSDTIAKLTLNNEVFTNPNHAVEGLGEYSHMWILFVFHKNDSTHVRAKVSPPRLNGARTGVFATRSPHRPSPIGLSLVKIDRIMGDTVYFSGVDMIDQTPVLDLKPYIPQYDNPGIINTFIQQEEMTDLRRVGNNVESFQLTASTSSYEPEDLQIENLQVRTMDGEENHQRQDVVGAVSTDHSNSRSALDELLYTRINSRIGEREAPDGEEEEPSNNTQVVNHVPIPTTPEGHIRVPSWVNQPPVPTLSVTFKDRALSQLRQLGAEGEEKKLIIINVLTEDPRSVYLRERWGSHCYVFRISELYVSCKFNDTDHTVTVYQVFQNEVPEGSD